MRRKLLHCGILAVATTVIGVLVLQDMRRSVAPEAHAETRQIRPAGRRREPVRKPLPATRTEPKTLDATPLERQAMRLSERLQRRFDVEKTTLELTQALGEKQRLMNANVNVHMVSDADGSKAADPWTVSLGQYPTWLAFDPEETGRAMFRVDDATVRSTIASPDDGLSRRIAKIVNVTPDEKGLLRAEMTNAAVGGFSMDASAASYAISSAISQGDTDATVLLREEPTIVYFQTGGTLRRLQLLASGTSDFAGSPLGREANVKKAMTERVTNILVPPGGKFSYNKAIGDMANQYGWHLALGIFNGGELRQVRGGGICQGATTLYRAALNAGLPIDTWRNHSLFVSYYKEGGVGVDATVYPGEQDLVFTNDTGDYLFVQGSVEGTEARFDIFGVPDGRKVAMEGPYFTANAPEDVTNKGKKLQANEIAWKRIITRRGEATAEEEIFVSRYKGLPKGLAGEFISDNAEIALQ